MYIQSLLRDTCTVNSADLCIFIFYADLTGVSVIVSPINHLHIFIMQYKCPWESVRTDESAFPWMHFENEPEISLILMKAFHAKVCLTELYSLIMHLKRFHFSPSDNWHKIYRIKQGICFDQSPFKCLSCLHISFTEPCTKCRISHSNPVVYIY